MISTASMWKIAVSFALGALLFGVLIQKPAAQAGAKKPSEMLQKHVPGQQGSGGPIVKP